MPPQSTSAIAVAPSPKQSTGFDLRAMFRAARSRGGPPTSPTPRRVVRLLEPDPRDIRGIAPLVVTAYADGVQNQVILRHVEHRPVTLVWVAAGAVTTAGKLIRFRQRLALVASETDAGAVHRLAEVGGGVPVHLVQDLMPWGVAAATQRMVDEWRRELEREVVLTAPVPDGERLVVDGPIRHYRRPGLVGLVKAVDATQYLADETGLPTVAGWRSGAFHLPARTTAESDVISAYVRCHEAPGTVSWSHGLIRVEAPDLATLDAACALAVRSRQSPGSGDPRWTTMIEPMATTEQVLKAYRPFALEI